ncbi:MAG: helix-turn-helix domain-containing protein, partial [bacterium]|nr:helix-turn-helix domain-containing protein [bacterium]
MTAVFRAFTEGLGLKQYIEARRIEVAAVLILITNLDLDSISEKIGYTHYPTFTEAYKRQKKILPSGVVREHLPPPEVDDGTSLRAGRGLLTVDAFVRYVEDLMPLYQGAEKDVHIGPCPDPEPLIVIVDGAADDLMKAEDLWRKIRDLPFDEQCRMVRGYRFGSTVLFDLLRKQSLLEGRK